MNQAPVCTAQLDPNNPGRVNIYNARVAYADGLNAPKAGKPDPQTGKVGEPRWSAVFLIPDSAVEALNAIQTAMWTAAQNKWADKAGVIWQSLQASNKLALKPGATKADQDGFMGHYFLSGGNPAGKIPLLLSNFAGPDGQPAVLPRPQSMIYSGCYVNAQIDLWVQDNDYGKRINTEIKVVQFAQEGPSFGGGAAADTSVFGAVQAPNGGMGAPSGVGGFTAAPPAQQGFPQQAAPQQAAPQQGFPQQAAPQQGFPQQAAPQQAAPQQGFPQQGFPQPGGFPQAAPQTAPGGWTPPGM